jgi:uncharacterized protein with HEPN domain
MAPLPPRDGIRLRHMLAAASKALDYVDGHERAILDSDEMRALALVRLLEILGEASRAVSDTTRDRYPTIPWRQIAGTRDRLIHGYEAVDLDIVWAIVTTDLPALIAEVEKVLAGET